MSPECNLPRILSRDWAHMHQRSVLFRGNFNDTVGQDEVQTVRLLMCIRHYWFGHHHELWTVVSIL